MHVVAFALLLTLVAPALALPRFSTSYFVEFTAPLCLSPEIVDELKDFVDLIPTATVDEIVAKHYVIDGNFRKAFNFLRSGQFKQLLEQLQQVPEVIAILDYLHLSDPTRAGSDACPRSPLPADESIDFVLLDNEIGGGGGERRLLTTACGGGVATFTSFVEELLEHLPRGRYVQMIDEKRQRSAAFAQFYTALRSDQLRPIVEGALKSANLAGIVNTLSGHDVDVKSLEPIAFRVISWGPDLAALTAD